MPNDALHSVPNLTGRYGAFENLKLRFFKLKFRLNFFNVDQTDRRSRGKIEREDRKRRLRKVSGASICR